MLRDVLLNSNVAANHPNYKKYVTTDDSREMLNIIEAEQVDKMRNKTELATIKENPIPCTKQRQEKLENQDTPS